MYNSSAIELMSMNSIRTYKKVKQNKESNYIRSIKSYNERNRIIIIIIKY